MIDLAAKVHYKARFEICKAEPDVSLFSTFLIDVQKWIKRNV